MSQMLLWGTMLYVHVPWLLAAEDADTSAAVLDLNSLVGGGAGAALVGILYYVGKLILDRTIPTRSDARANITMLLEGLQSMVEVLQKEKDADAARLKERQNRIDTLEEESDSSFARRAEMQAEIIDLRARVAQKDRHIKQLVHMLVSLGATVEGIETDTLEITLPAHSSEVAQAKKDAGLAE